jgi:hypothetical protein
MQWVNAISRSDEASNYKLRSLSSLILLFLLSALFAGSTGSRAAYIVSLISGNGSSSRHFHSPHEKEMPALSLVPSAFEPSVPRFLSLSQMIVVLMRKSTKRAKKSFSSHFPSH